MATTYAFSGYFNFLICICHQVGHDSQNRFRHLGLYKLGQEKQLPSLSATPLCDR